MKDKTVALLLAILIVLSAAAGRAWSEQFMERWRAGWCACSRVEERSAAKPASLAPKWEQNSLWDAAGSGILEKNIGRKETV